MLAQQERERHQRMCCRAEFITKSADALMQHWFGDLHASQHDVQGLGGRQPAPPSTPSQFDRPPDGISSSLAHGAGMWQQSHSPPGLLPTMTYRAALTGVGPHSSTDVPEPILADLNPSLPVGGAASVLAEIPKWPLLQAEERQLQMWMEKYLDRRVSMSVWTP